MNYRCSKCLTDKSLCIKCRSNPIIQDILNSLPKHDYFQVYIPVCPRGYTDCVWDPGYIKYFYPDWYEDLYGNMLPEEAIHAEGGCCDKVTKDPNEDYYCYDDEDK